jgi:LmbE family N-acetylglucosaminyl deacetylase
VLSLGPDGAYGHPDHLAVNHWVAAAWHSLDGLRPALLLAAFPRGLFLPQYEKCRAMMGDPPSPPPEAIGGNWDIEVDISAVRDVKLGAVACHRSQLPSPDPHSLFPPGILEGTLRHERFAAVGGSPGALAALAKATGG